MSIKISHVNTTSRECGVPKKFPLYNSSHSMKLTQKKIRWIIKRYDEGMPVSEIAFLTNVTERRVRQIIQSYKEKGRIPMIKKPGRKRRKLTQDEKEIIMKSLMHGYGMNLSLACMK